MGFIQDYLQVTYLIGDLKTVKNFSVDTSTYEIYKLLMSESTDRVCEVKVVSVKLSEYQKLNIIK